MCIKRFDAIFKDDSSHIPGLIVALDSAKDSCKHDKNGDTGILGLDMLFNVLLNFQDLP